MGSEHSQPHRSLVLFVDDDPVVSRIAGEMLARHEFEMEWCPDAETALLRVRRPPLPDVILLDLEMPGGSGIDFCRLARQDAALGRVPIMICSAHAKEQFIDAGFRAGANDYIEKPFTEAELVARVENLSRMARSVQALRSTLLQLRRRNEALALELEAARQVQGALLPVTLTPHPSLRSAVLYEPMFGVGGDLYDVGLGADGTVRLLIADVSGHGVFAALLAAFFKMGYQVYSDREPGPAAVLNSLHREFCRSVQSGHFVTVLLVWLDPTNGRMRYASAGHVPGLLRRAREETMERLLPTGPVLGLVEQCRCTEVETRLDPEDSLLLVTDGVLEAPSPAGEPYGIARLETLARRHRPGNPAELLQDLRIDLEQFQHSPDGDDDCTALAVDWTPRATQAGWPQTQSTASETGWDDTETPEGRGTGRDRQATRHEEEMQAATSGRMNPIPADPAPRSATASDPLGRPEFRTGP